MSLTGAQAALTGDQASLTGAQVSQGPGDPAWHNRVDRAEQGS